MSQLVPICSNFGQNLISLDTIYIYKLDQMGVKLSKCWTSNTVEGKFHHAYVCSRNELRS